MSSHTQRLAHRGATTLGFALLIPGVVMLMWFYSAVSGITIKLYTIAVALSIAGATFLIIAITLRITQHFKRGNEALGTTPQADPTAQEPNRTRHSIHRDLHQIPSYRTVMADSTGGVWTVPREPLEEGGLQLRQISPPPQYESVVKGGPPLDVSHLASVRVTRRVESEGDAGGRMERLDLEPWSFIEPLTPPPLYHLDQVFDFSPGSEEEEGPPVDRERHSQDTDTDRRSIATH
ncbi:uncharacterized protein [Heptranchias perlo]|uniref:uncharacterized protein n=1 Tax=Heptranchias perlo TaxID=212740 RepID=UPI00355A9CED